MSSEVPHSAGWYPDASTGGTAYWDGSAWTGHGRPRRRRFAARARHRWVGTLFLLAGALLVVAGSLAFWVPKMSLWTMFRDDPQGVFEVLARAVQDSQGVVFSQALATFAIEAGLGLSLAAAGVYLLRGQGPTTWAVRERLAERHENDWLTRRVPTFAGWYPDPNGTGTAYWDGSGWTGDTRPRRRSFAAKASGTHLIPLVVMSGGGWGALCIGAAYEDGFTIGWFLVGLAALVGTVLGCIYLVRGRGPSTISVKRRLAPPASGPGSDRGGLGFAFFAVLAAFVIGAASRRDDESENEDEHDTSKYLLVPPGLARKKWSFEEGTPVQAMRENRNGDVEVTFDGTHWEDPKREPSDWVRSDGEPHEWP